MSFRPRKRNKSKVNVILAEQIHCGPFNLRLLLIGVFGYKLSHNPDLREQSDQIFATFK